MSTSSSGLCSSGSAASDVGEIDRLAQTKMQSSYSLSLKRRSSTATSLGSLGCYNCLSGVAESVFAINGDPDSWR